jgi:hypothetical protein
MSTADVWHSRKASVKCNSLVIIEILKEEYEICLVLFNDLPDFQHFTFYARIRRLRM